MIDEYKAFIKTWSLVPYLTGMNVVENKCVFQVRYKPNGTMHSKI